MVFIFNFSFSQSSFLNHRPHHRFKILIKRAVHRKFQKLRSNRFLSFKGHGLIAIVPLPLHTKALHLFLLHAHPFIRKGTAFAAKFIHRNIVFVFLFFSVFFLNLPFNRKAMTIPAMNIRAVKPKHVLRTCHNVFQGFIQRMTNMNIAIRIRRAIMQNKLRAPFALLSQF